MSAPATPHVATRGDGHPDEGTPVRLVISPKHRVFGSVDEVAAHNPERCRAHRVLEGPRTASDADWVDFLDDPDAVTYAPVEPGYVGETVHAVATVTPRQSRLSGRDVSALVAGRVPADTLVWDARWMGLYWPSSVYAVVEGTVGRGLVGMLVVKNARPMLRSRLVEVAQASWLGDRVRVVG